MFSHFPYSSDPPFDMLQILTLDWLQQYNSTIFIVGITNKLTNIDTFISIIPKETSVDEKNLLPSVNTS